MAEAAIQAALGEGQTIRIELDKAVTTSQAYCDQAILNAFNPNMDNSPLLKAVQQILAVASSILVSGSSHVRHAPCWVRRQQG